MYKSSNHPQNAHGLCLHLTLDLANCSARVVAGLGFRFSWVAPLDNSNTEAMGPANDLPLG